MEITKVSYRSWKVESDSGKDYYVIMTPKGFRCNCLGFVTHEVECKHIKYIKELLRGEIKPTETLVETYNGEASHLPTYLNFPSILMVSTKAVRGD
jgi:hypothetical protein